MQEAQTNKKILWNTRKFLFQSDKFMFILEKVTTFKSQPNYSSHQHRTEDLKILNKME